MPQNEFARPDLGQQQQQRLRLRLRQLRRRCRVYQAGGALSEAKVSPAEGRKGKRGTQEIFSSNIPIWFSSPHRAALLTVVRLIDSIVRIGVGVGKMCPKLVQEFIQLLYILADAAQLLLLEIGTDLLAQQYLAEHITKIRGCSASRCCRRREEGGITVKSLLD